MGMLISEIDRLMEIIINPDSIKDIDNPTRLERLLAVKFKGTAIEHIPEEYQDEETQTMAVISDPAAMKYIYIKDAVHAKKLIKANKMVLKHLFCSLKFSPDINDVNEFYRILNSASIYAIEEYIKDDPEYILQLPSIKYSLSNLAITFNNNILKVKGWIDRLCNNDLCDFLRANMSIILRVNPNILGEITITGDCEELSSIFMMKNGLYFDTIMRYIDVHPLVLNRIYINAFSKFPDKLSGGSCNPPDDPCILLMIFAKCGWENVKKLKTDILRKPEVEEMIVKYGSYWTLKSIGYSPKKLKNKVKLWFRRFNK